MELSKEERGMLKEYIIGTLLEVFSDEEIEVIIEKYREKEGEGNMLAETLKKEREMERKKDRHEARREGKIIGLKTVAKEMLKEEVELEKIIKWTKLKRAEIEELRREINNQ